MNKSFIFRYKFLIRMRVISTLYILDEGIFNNVIIEIYILKSANCVMLLKTEEFYLKRYLLNNYLFTVFYA